MAMYTGNDTTITDSIFGTQDTISETEDTEFLSAAEAKQKLEEVIYFCHVYVLDWCLYND